MTNPSHDLAARHGVVAVIPRDGELLVIRRSQTVAAPGKLCFPGGHIEVEESESDALKRELIEELNLAVVPVRRLWNSVTRWNVRLAWWLVEASCEDTPVANPSEVEAVHWCCPRELASRNDLLESNFEFLKAWNAGQFDVPGF